MSRYRFRPATAADLPMLQHWLRTPEVARWWGDPDEQAALLAGDLAEPLMTMLVVELDGAPFAYAPKAKHIYQKLGQPHDTVFVDPGAAVVLEVLLDAGARIDTTDDAGDTPLHLAVRGGSLRGVQALLKHGAKVTVKNRAGETPLSLAKARESAEMLKLLTEKR